MSKTLKTPILDSLLCVRGPSKGLIIVFDMQNTGIKHLLRTKVETLRMFFRYLQDALPAKLEAMHIINCASFIDMVMTMIKPFMKSDILSRVC
jgi:CRAL/TRIO domain